jgi:hypothetical protein
MKEEGRRGAKAVKLRLIVNRKSSVESIELPQLYGRINARNVVEYGLIGVTAADCPRLMKAIMQLGMRLLEIGGSQ